MLANQAQTQCIISVTGFKKNVQTPGPKHFTFTPDNALAATMALATFDQSSWTGLTKVALEITSAAATVPLTVLGVDTVKYALTKV